MTKIDSQDVLKLRKETGLGVMACKKALIGAQGDLEKARAKLTTRSKEKSVEKQDREIKAGLIDSYIHHHGRVGVLVKLGCETDFVAKNKDFKELAHELSLQIASMDPQDVKQLLAQPSIRDEQKKIQDLIDEAIAKLGEKIEVVEFVRYHI